MQKRRLFLAGLLGVSAALAGCEKLGMGGSSKPAFKGIDLTGADYARDFQLVDQHGQARTLGDFRGKVLVVFFGFTQCPDVCPTTLAELAQVKKALGPDGERVQGIFISVDPERDTPDLLKAYLASFDPSFVALRGSADQTQAVAKEFKVYYAKVPGKTEGSYSIDHTAASYLFDSQGRVRVFSRYGSGAQALTDDLKVLLAEKS
ncbi:SCO family protein [Roseateles sp.]|jgi:protein SCO1/2|uniref:SCO family protein n=1 Tax=Roseateles sp. TaxID=1971397 RepID=UPI0037C74DEE